MGEDRGGGADSSLRAEIGRPSPPGRSAVQIAGALPITQDVLRMLFSRALRHRLELVIAVCAIAAVVAVAGSTRSTTKTFARGESWRHATGSLVSLTARSHVWLEEFFAGDHGNDPERDIIAPLHRAQQLCIALQFGGTTPMGRV